MMKVYLVFYGLEKKPRFRGPFDLCVRYIFENCRDGENIQSITEELKSNEGIFRNYLVISRDEIEGYVAFTGNLDDKYDRISDYWKDKGYLK